MVQFSRRNFLTTIRVAGGAAALRGLVPGWLREVGPHEPVPLRAADFKALSDAALGRARALGCTYTDIRITRRRDGSIAHRAESGRHGTLSVRPRVESERLLVGVRVIHSGGWGYAEASTLTTDTIARTTARAVASARATAALADRPVAQIPKAAGEDCWVARHDRFDRPLDAHLAALVAANNHGARSFAADETYFVSSKGALDHSATLSVA